MDRPTSRIIEEIMCNMTPEELEFKVEGNGCLEFKKNIRKGSGWRIEKDNRK